MTKLWIVQHTNQDHSANTDNVSSTTLLPIITFKAKKPILILVFSSHSNNARDRWEKKKEKKAAIHNRHITCLMWQYWLYGLVLNSFVSSYQVWPTDTKKLLGNALFWLLVSVTLQRKVLQSQQSIQNWETLNMNSKCPSDSPSKLENACTAFNAFSNDLEHK